MSTTPREIGTLIVVVLKANHLPNKRHIGKQDPYCVVSVNGEKRRTKAIKRGGQHPEWDEEIRFTLYEDVNDLLERTAHGDGTPPPPPPKDDKGPKKIKGGKIMKLSCFADDPREPDLIGEADVDLTEVLTKGETDEWFTLMNKDKFSGKVYLELTFWSNEPPPEKKVTPKPAKSKQYGGPGSFVPSGELPSPITTNGSSHPSRIVSTSSLYDHSRQNSDTIPSSLRASSSLAKLDLYVPPYEQRNRISPVDKIANEFGEFGISETHRRRESFPPPRGGHTPRPSSPVGYSTVSSQQSYGYDHNISEAMSNYTYDQSAGQSSLHQRSAMSGVRYSSQPPYQTQYEPTPSIYHQPPIRGPRHSIPTSSSGFMPLPTNPSGFVTISSHSSEPAIFSPPPSHTPAPMGYNSSQFNPQQTYTQVPSQTVIPNGDSYLPASSSSSFHPQQLAFPQSHSFQYPQYPPTPSTPTPSQSYSLSSLQGQPPAVQSGPQTYQAYATTPSPSHDNTSAPLSQPASFNTGSRPLPQQPHVVYGQQTVSVPYIIPPATGAPQQLNSYSPSQPAVSPFPTNGSYQSIPPPPPPPSMYTGGQPQQAYIPNSQQSNAGIPLPPPPPLQSVPGSTSRRQSSLPQPPVNYQLQGQPVYQQPPPPPPPPPSDFFAHNLPPPPPPPPAHMSNQNTLYHPSPPSNHPPQQDGQGQWIPTQ